VFFLGSSVLAAQAQQLSWHEQWVNINSDTTRIDSVSIAPNTFAAIASDGNSIAPSSYVLDEVNALLIWKDPLPTDSIRISYRSLAINFGASAEHKDRNKLSETQGTRTNPFSYTPGKGQLNDPFLSSSGLNKSGSISRGIAFGNSQDLSVNSNLQLELSGKISENLNVLASVTDDNIPIQPEGNTQQLQDFDQVFIQLYNDRTSLVAGDFQLRLDDRYFMKYFKKAQGVSAKTKFRLSPEEDLAIGEEAKIDPLELQLTGSLAASRGKFSRNVIQGIEGNQGPYRLKGANNETFIIVLSGTERVFIDGRLLKRGQEYDYIINYNTSEIIFTANQLITKDKRITVEFQYSDKNYARFINSFGAEVSNKRMTFFLDVYNEFDSKNQPLQLELDAADRAFLNGIGDDINSALLPSVDSVPFDNNFVLYALVDSLGYDSVLLYSTNPDSAFYQVGFSEVGAQNGDYVLQDFNANGRVYKWVAPDTTITGEIVPQGNYAAVTQLVTPKQQLLIVGGGEYRWSDRTTVGAEVALSNYDINTFSKLDAGDDLGGATKAWVTNKSSIQKKDNPWELHSRFEAELVQSNFTAIERFRSVEFERNWNIKNQQLVNTQYLAKGELALRQLKKGSVRYTADAFRSEGEYEGLRNQLAANLKLNGLRIVGNGSFLTSNGLNQTQFLRHKATIEKDISFLTLSYADEHEYNLFYVPESKDSLANNSYRFYDWKTSLGSRDTAKINYSVFYQQRTDWAQHRNDLKSSTFAESFGAKVAFLKNPANQIKLRVAYRKLYIRDTLLTNSAPDNTLLGRLEYNFKIWKDAVRSTTFYEIGSGLELEKEFVYVQVVAGQGLYAWIDYNDDNVKDLNEFELAAFSDQAEYIRVFTPANNYVKTFSNQFNQVLNVNFGRLWKGEKGVKGLLSKLSSQASFRVDRKTNALDRISAYQPWLTNIEDQELLNLNASWRVTTWINRDNAKWGLTHNYQSISGKTLLNGGFDSRSRELHSIQGRLNLHKKITVTTDTEAGTKSSASDFLAGRNYAINYQSVEGKVAYQPSTTFRISFSGKYTEKRNASELGGELALIRDIGTEIRYNVVKKGSLLLNVNLINISYSGLTNTSLGFEMLEALLPGVNYTWSSSYQRKLSKNLQLTLNYNGRGSNAPDSRTVHTGGMSIRAFF